MYGAKTLCVNVLCMSVFSERPLMGGKLVCTGSDPAAARSQTVAGLCVYWC